MKETQGTKETEGTRWRVGIVAPDCSPSMAMDPRAFTDEEVAAFAGGVAKYGELDVVHGLGV